MHTGLLLLLFVVVALFIGIVIRTLLLRTGFPYSVTLLLLGLLMGAASHQTSFNQLMPELSAAIQLVSTIDGTMILFIFLPALIFESAFSLEVHLFRRMFSQIALLAVPGMLIASLLTAAFCLWLLPLQWSLPVALVFGTLISATDPVAVVALLKEMCSRARLQTLIEGESLLNDGTAIVLFTLFMALATQGGALAPGTVIQEFIRVVSVGVLIGLVLGFITLQISSRVFNEPTIEIILTLATPYLAFYVAEHQFHASGVVSVVTLALIYAGPGRTRFSPEVTSHLHHVWETLAHIFNTLIFLLVGIIVAYRISPPALSEVLWLLALYGGILAIRSFSVVVLMPLLSRIGIGITREKAVVLCWGGLRGAVSLALALSVVQSDALPLALRDQILFLSAGIVVLTIVINGASMRALMKYLKLDRPPPAKQRTLDKAERIATEQVSKLISELRQDSSLPNVNWPAIEQLHPEIPQLYQPEQTPEDSDTNIAFQRKLLESERQYYWNLFGSGLLSQDATSRLNAAIEDALDGAPKISPRPLLERSWRLPGWLRFCNRFRLLQPFTRSLMLQNLMLRFETARGMLQAQRELRSLLPKVALSEQQLKQTEPEIDANCQRCQKVLQLLEQRYPELVTEIETRIACRMLLNSKRSGLEKLAHQGMLGEADAEKLIEQVEQKMHLLQKGLGRGGITPPR